MTIEELVKANRYQDAYLRICQGEECDPYLADEIRIVIEGTIAWSDNIFRNVVINLERN
jgi:hypothetical protein